jgi:hypothetical protein
MLLVKKNIVKEPLIIARNKAEVKTYLLSEYPQFFQNDKIYEKETKDLAQFFYVVIYELYNYEIETIELGKWHRSYCKHEHDNRYVSKPRVYIKLFPDAEFCKNDDDTCLNNFKNMYFKDVELPDVEAYIRKDSLIYIYKITEKATGKCYI